MNLPTSDINHGDEIVARMCDLFERREIDEFLTLWADDCEVIDVATGATHVGHRALLDLLDTYYDALSGVRFAESHVHYDPRGVITFRHVMEGRHTGVFRNVPPTGRRLRWSACSIYDLTPDFAAVQREWFYYDEGALLRQLH